MNWQPLAVANHTLQLHAISGLRPRIILSTICFPRARVGAHTLICVFPYPFYSLLENLLKEKKETRKQEYFSSYLYQFQYIRFHPRHYRVSTCDRKHGRCFYGYQETTLHINRDSLRLTGYSTTGGHTAVDV